MKSVQLQRKVPTEMVEILIFGISETKLNKVLTYNQEEFNTSLNGMLPILLTVV